ncbi:hypothetical protein P280DRAFT_470333 [Massarina eburnea CBS 473.64]|uniref:Uncharacterized protein n=1 Tax=Massarina eburnea CBS 473.64 TaxID=1395130 RepID=A0A6A6RX37_9PLEO|nr:hypothetical protein P280DRAFT_470333 [Massarina eburnea CBS 473.64]
MTPLSPLSLSAKAKKCTLHLISRTVPFSFDHRLDAPLNTLLLRRRPSARPINTSRSLTTAAAPPVSVAVSVSVSISAPYRFRIAFASLPSERPRDALRFSLLRHHGFRTGDLNSPPAAGPRVVPPPVDTAGVRPARLQDGVPARPCISAVHRPRHITAVVDVDHSLLPATPAPRQPQPRGGAAAGAVYTGSRCQPRREYDPQ